MRRSETIAEQAAKPTGILGWIVGAIMAKETQSDNAKAMQLLSLETADRVIDIGTGHGQSLATLARATANGAVTGVDSSAVMLGIAKRKNSALIKTGRISLHLAPAHNMPFADGAFNKAMAVHTLYFWNPALAYLQEVFRILQPGGRFVLAYRPAEDQAVVDKFPASVYCFRSTQEVSALAYEAGFIEQDSVYDATAGKSIVWLCLTKP